MSKIYSSNEELTAKIAAGINKLADNVASTLGPRGRNVILQKKDGKPIVTKDGVTVAEFVEPRQAMELPQLQSWLVPSTQTLGSLLPLAMLLSK